MSTIQRIHSLVYQCTISKVQQIYPDTVSSSLQQEFTTAQEIYIQLLVVINTISLPYSQRILCSICGQMYCPYI